MYSDRRPAAAANESCSPIEKVQGRRTLRVQPRREFSTLDSSLAVKGVARLGRKAHAKPEQVIVGGLRCARCSQCPLAHNVTYTGQQPLELASGIPLALPSRLANRRAWEGGVISVISCPIEGSRDCARLSCKCLKCTDEALWSCTYQRPRGIHMQLHWDEHVGVRHVKWAGVEGYRVVETTMSECGISIGLVLRNARCSTRSRGSVEESFILTAYCDGTLRKIVKGWTILECGVSTDQPDVQ